jgi:translation initiation factor 2 beta subunit (eIF-2beta)/eIF-5
MSRLLCWLFGHKNTISCVADGRLTHDKCERCGAKLPVAYPYHELYRILRGEK